MWWCLNTHLTFYLSPQNQTTNFVVFPWTGVYKAGTLSLPMCTSNSWLLFTRIITLHHNSVWVLLFPHDNPLILFRLSICRHLLCPQQQGRLPKHHLLGEMWSTLPFYSWMLWVELVFDKVWNAWSEGIL